MLKADQRFKSWDRFLPILLKRGQQFRADGVRLVALRCNDEYVLSRLKKLQRRSLNQNLSLDGAKYAVVVSKKVAKSAVVRNRIRRRVYEWIRQNQDQIIKGRLYAVFIYRQDFATQPSSDLSNLLKDLFSQVKLKD